MDKNEPVDDPTDENGGSPSGSTSTTTDASGFPPGDDEQAGTPGPADAPPAHTPDDATDEENAGTPQPDPAPNRANDPRPDPADVPTPDPTAPDEAIDFSDDEGEQIVADPQEVQAIRDIQNYSVRDVINDLTTGTPPQEGPAMENNDGADPESGGHDDNYWERMNEVNDELRHHETHEEGIPELVHEPIAD